MSDKVYVQVRFVKHPRFKACLGMVVVPLAEGHKLVHELEAAGTAKFNFDPQYEAWFTRISSAPHIGFALRNRQASGFVYAMTENILAGLDGVGAQDMPQADVWDLLQNLGMPDFFGGGRRRYVPGRQRYNFRVSKVRFGPAHPFAAPSTSRSPWAVLGIEPTSDKAVALAAYRKKALALHPDRGGDEKAMAKLNEAWDTIKAMYGWGAQPGRAP